LRGSDKSEESRAEEEPIDEEEEGWRKLGEQNKAASKRAEKRKLKGMEIGLQIAMFIRFYGQNTYRNQLYKTRDRVIPFALFYYLSRALEHNVAYELLQEIQGVSLGVGQVWGGKNTGKLHRLIDKIQKDSFVQKLK
jgi:hypothetical protein